MAFRNLNSKKDLPGEIIVEESLATFDDYDNVFLSSYGFLTDCLIRLLLKLIAQLDLGEKREERSSLMRVLMRIFVGRSDMRKELK